MKTRQLKTFKIIIRKVDLANLIFSGHIADKRSKENLLDILLDGSIKWLAEQLTQ